MTDTETAYQEFKDLESKVLKILEKYPHPNVSKKEIEAKLEAKLNLPYPPGIVWHRDPDPYITRRLRENFRLTKS